MWMVWCSRMALSPAAMLRGAHEVGRGDAMTGAAPSGVVTFLFTDVEGSTRRWEADAHAGGACRTRRGAAQRDRDAQGRVVQTHRRRRVRSILVAEVRCRCRRGR